jgi:hypothetical protein
LERKSKPIFDLLEQTNHDWEAVLFCLLAKNFGLNTNGEIFLEIAKYSFSIVRKESFEVENLEALVLEPQDYWILKRKIIILKI